MAVTVHIGSTDPHWRQYGSTDVAGFASSRARAKTDPRTMCTAVLVGAPAVREYTFSRLTTDVRTHTHEAKMRHTCAPALIRTGGAR